MAIIHILLVWLLASVIFAALLLILFVFRPKAPCISETFPDSNEPQVECLNYQIHANCFRLRTFTDKISKIKETISKVEKKKMLIQSEYNKLLKDLKDTLVKTESECKSLSSQIETLAAKRLKMKMEMQKRKNGISELHFQKSLV